MAGGLELDGLGFKGLFQTILQFCHSMSQVYLFSLLLAFKTVLNYFFFNTQYVCTSRIFPELDPIQT